MDGDQKDFNLWVDTFLVRPHFNSNYFTKVNTKNLEKAAKKVDYLICALDGQNVVEVGGDKVEIVSEGEFRRFN